MRTIERSSAFKRDYQRAKATPRHSKDLESRVSTAVALLLSDQVLPENNRDHALSGDWAGYRECHIKPDHDALSWQYAHDVRPRRRTHCLREAIGSTTRRDAWATHLGPGPAIARGQSTPEGAQWGLAFRAEGRRLETRSAHRKQIAG